MLIGDLYYDKAILRFFDNLSEYVNSSDVMLLFESSL